MACLLILASCIKDGFVTSFDGSNGRLAIDFSTTTEATKADLTNSDLQQNGWGLFGYYTGTSDYTKPGDAQGVLFNHRQVSWDSTNSLWDYSRDEQHKKEYWPMSSDEKVSFFAYAPYEGFQANASVDATNGPQVTYTATTDLAAQKDLLWATNTSGLPHRNVGLASYPDSTVDMHFRHAPAKIHFTINGATLGDETAVPVLYGNPNTSTSYSNLSKTNERTGGTYNNYYTLYYAYRTKTVVTTQTYRQALSGFKILLNSVEMENFIREGTLHLNNPDAYVPYWTHEASGEEDFLTYTFGTSDMVASVTNPNNESTLSSGWGTTYLGVDSDPKELLPTPNNYIYMVPKAAKTGEDADENITITVTYHIIGLSKTVEFTRTTTTVLYQRVPYYTRNGNARYQTGSNQYGQYSDANALTSNTILWDDIVDSDHPSTTNDVDGASTDVNVEFNYSQDNDGAGFLAVGSINSDIVGSRDYTINLYLDGRELRLTVIPQPWDLNETMYDYNSTLNPVIQALTYDSDFVYEVIGSNVYINNRMGKFYFKLGPGMYLYWQASLIGDDAFAFTDANGNYLLDEKGNYRTTVRGDIGDAMNYIYVKAINTSSPVTSKAKLRIYLFNSENRAVVALPKPPDWLFLSSTFINDQNQTERVQEWTVVQTAN
jgi:hypothetical protein